MAPSHVRVLPRERFTLGDLLMARTRVCGGVYLTLTMRCPLSCAHCSSASTTKSPQFDELPFLALAESFSPESAPGVVVMTGGEPLMRPRLVRAIADHTRRVGSKTVIATGGFFALQKRVGSPLKTALAGADLVVFSMDAYHEREVSRSHLLDALDRVAELGPAVAVQLTGLTSTDPYIANALDAIDSRFGDEVPVFVNLLAAVGRATDLPEMAALDEPGALRQFAQPNPCALAAWPNVAADGAVYACCNSDMASGVAGPRGLVLGHAATDSWHQIALRSTTSPFMRAIRSLGPELTAELTGQPCTDMCGTCQAMASDPVVVATVESLMSSPMGRASEAVIQHQVAGRDRLTAAEWIWAAYRERG